MSVFIICGCVTSYHKTQWLKTTNTDSLLSQFLWARKEQLSQGVLAWVSREAAVTTRLNWGCSCLQACSCGSWQAWFFQSCLMTQQLGSLRERIQQGSFMLAVTAHHFYCILFVRRVSKSRPHVGWGRLHKCQRLPAVIRKRVVFFLPF